MPETGSPHAPPLLLARAGLDAATVARIDHLVVGCGGFARELLQYTAGACEVKDSSGQRVTEADRIVDRTLCENLLQLVPHSAGYSEEGGHFGERRGGLSVHWLVDPIDGTRPATLGGAFGVSVGALISEDEQPVAAMGWVYIAALSCLYRGILAPGFRECRINGRVRAEDETQRLSPLANCYLAVQSNWRSDLLPRSPMKLYAAGSTTVHLTQLIHPGTDLAAAALTRYKGYDVAGALVAVVAAGRQVRPLDGGAVSAEGLDPLRFLQDAHCWPDQYGPPVLVSTDTVAEALRA